MQVCFNSFSNSLLYPNFKGINKNAEISLLSAGKECIVKRPEYIAHTNIKRIASEEEFDRVLNRLKNDRTWMGGWWNRPAATKYEQALIPYTGEQDRSVVFNCYMNSGNIVDPSFSEEITREYIRAMDYALPEIDKVYGKYSGIVYRCGFMENVPKNFISTARDPRGITNIITSREDYYKPFYIIFTNNGHKIEEMQKKLFCRYASETEIILDPGTKYEEITEITPKMKELERNLIKSIRTDIPMPDGLNVTFLKEI